MLKHQKVQDWTKLLENWNFNLYWWEGISVQKKPLDHARAPKAEEWRQKGEGLSYGCIAKGKKEGSSNVNFMLGISFNKDVVLCEQYFGSITTTKFAKTVENMVPRGS